jgi:membrane fusion protein (multidrug efflux system)
LSWRGWSLTGWQDGRHAFVSVHCAVAWKNIMAASDEIVPCQTPGCFAVQQERQCPNRSSSRVRRRPARAWDDLRPDGLGATCAFTHKAYMIRASVVRPSLASLVRASLPALAIAFVLSGCGEKREAAKAAPPPPEVVVLPARTATVPVIREYVGNVQAYRAVEVRARVEGILDRRHFTEGTDVTKGQLLYTIDPAQFEAKVKDAEGELARAQATLANARAKANRLEPLAREEAISKQDYDDAVAAQKSAEAQVDSARANVETAKLNLGYTRVYATESGRIGRTQVPEGRLVGRGEPTLLATIDRIDPIYVTFTMPDRDSIILRRAFDKGEIRQGAGSGTARFILPDGSDLADVGKLDFSDAQVNPQTGTITQRAVLANRKQQLLPGMFVKVDLKVGEKPDAILIPQRAVVKVPNGHVAWVVDANNKVERRDLVVGEWNNGDWIIEKGLQKGDRVIVDGVQRVQPGTIVKPVPMPPGQAAGAPAATAPPASVAPRATPAKVDPSAKSK